MTRWMAGILALGLVAGTGCAINFAKRSPWDIQQLAELSDELEQFRTLARLRTDEALELRRAKALLEGGVASTEMSVGYDDRGLVARMLDRVLFDSGKAELRQSAFPVLDHVYTVLQEVPDQPVGIEGHTDDVPITVSGWADNEALSWARAQSVVDYLVDRKGIDAARLTPVGYGELRPIVSNDTPEDRQKNRRVEIVILPQSSGQSYEAHASEASRGMTRYTK